jgi:hypothetical protein
LNSAIVLETGRMRVVPWEMRDWISFRRMAKDPDVLRYISDGRPGVTSTFRISFKGKSGICRARVLFLEVRAEGRQRAHRVPRAPTARRGSKEGSRDRMVACPRLLGARPGDGGGTTLRDGFERAGLGRVIALAQPANLASIRVMKKFAMSYERDVIHREYP